MVSKRQAILGAVIGLSIAALCTAAVLLLFQSSALPRKTVQRNKANPSTETLCEEKYSTSTFGYEFCYPTDWYLREIGDDKEVVGVDSSPIPEASEYAGQIVVTAWQKKSSEVVALLRETLDDPSEARRSLDGDDATVIIGIIPQGGSVSARTLLNAWIVERGRYSFEISYRNSSVTDTNIVTFSRLLGSWKWIDITKHAPVRSESVNIVVELPVYNAVVTSPLTIKGQVRAFEATFSWRLKNSQGGIVTSGTGTASSGETGTLQPFSVSAKFTVPKPPDPGTLELLTLSAQDGSEQDLVTIPVRFK